MSPSPQLLTDDDVTARLRALVESAGGVEAAARALGVSGSYLSLVLSGDRYAGPLIGRGLGLRKVRRWEDDTAARRARRTPPVGSRTG